jgi:predicted phage tail protein
MATMHTITGRFPARKYAEEAVSDLRHAGFARSSIDLDVSGAVVSRLIVHKYGNQVAEGAVAGGIVGAASGALMIAAGTLSFPAVGSFLSGGVFAALLGAAVGLLTGGMLGLSLPKEKAEFQRATVQ